MHDAYCYWPPGDCIDVAGALLAIKTTQKSNLSDGPHVPCAFQLPTLQNSVSFQKQFSVVPSVAYHRGSTLHPAQLWLSSVNCTGVTSMQHPKQQTSQNVLLFTQATSLPSDTIIFRLLETEVWPWLCRLQTLTAICLWRCWASW